MHEKLIRPDLLGPALARALSDPRWERMQASLIAGRPGARDPAGGHIAARVQAGSMAGQDFGDLSAEIDRIADEGLASLADRS